MGFEIRPVSGSGDLESWVTTRNEASPDLLTTEMRTLIRALELDYLDLLALEGDEPVGTAFISGDPRSVETRRPWFDVRVPERHRGRGVGSALLQAVSERARDRGYVGLRCSARADDPRSIGFLEHRGFSVAGRVEQMSLELDAPIPSRPILSSRVELVWLIDRPSLLAGMYELARDSDAVRSGRFAGVVLTESQWRVYELGSPLVRLDLTSVALVDGEVIGYSVVQDFPEYNALYHRALVVAPDWRRRGVAEALVHGQMVSAAAAGIRLMIAVPRSDALRRLYAEIGYAPRKSWLELEAALA